MTFTPTTIRSDAQGVACGQGFIRRGQTCHKQGAFPKRAAIAAGLTVTALGVGAIAISQRRRGRGGGSPSMPEATPSPSTPPRPPGPPLLTGITPRGLLRAAPPRQSKTQRMRANTQAAVRGAEQAMGRAAQAEITRAGAVANAMASAGEATGMAAKTTLRELRLRTEAARRRFEPGYRRGRQTQAPSPAQLPEGGTPLQIPFTPRAPRTPAERDPSTGQPRRRKARGFGRSDNYIAFYAPTQIQPPLRSDACWEGYVQAGMKRKGKREVPNCIPASSGLKKPRAQRDAESSEDGKKYTKVVTNPKTGRKNKVRYGAKGYTIAPGTERGNNYCTRSYGQMKKHGMNCAGTDKNTPLCLSRAKWRCAGTSSTNT